MADFQTLRAHIPMPVIRSLTALGFIAVFFSVAAIIRPTPTTAGNEAKTAPADFASAESAEAPAFIGSLEAPDMRVDVFITPEGPRYTVFASGSGSILAELIDASQLASEFPAFSPNQLHAEGEVEIEDELSP